MAASVLSLYRYERSRFKNAWPKLRILKRLRAFFAHKSAASAFAAIDTAALDQYVTTLPSAQNAVSLIPGWNHAFPPELGLQAGAVHLYHDGRILWCIEQAGSLSGRSVLELGPLEGMHTYMLSRAGAASVDAVEANQLAYLRCLITREILKYDNASFHLGDFVQWMEQPTVHYDLIVACGVLYHSFDPVRLIELISQKADSFFIWTHYFDEALNRREDLRGGPFSGHVKTQVYGPLTLHLHERHYYGAWTNPQFCGGVQNKHYWMTRTDILSLIDHLGFDVATEHETPEHMYGPAFSLFARRR